MKKQLACLLVGMFSIVGCYAKEGVDPQREEYCHQLASAATLFPVTFEFDKVHESQRILLLFPNLNPVDVVELASGAEGLAMCNRRWICTVNSPQLIREYVYGDCMKDRPITRDAFWHN